MGVILARAVSSESDGGIFFAFKSLHSGECILTAGKHRDDGDVELEFAVVDDFLRNLMVRSPASNRLDYDPITLKPRSCTGWSERELQAEMEYVTACAARDGGRSGQFFWVFPPPHLSRR